MIGKLYKSLSLVEQDARRIAKELYGIIASARTLPSERAQNFYLQDETGKEFVLKISNSGEDKDVLDFQNKVMEHFIEQNESPLCPATYTTISGEQITSIKSNDDFKHYVRLLTYLLGIPLAHVPHHSPELLNNYGQTLATLDKSLQGFPHPAMHRELYWDLKNASNTINNHITRIENREKRGIVQHFLAQYEKNVHPILLYLRTSVIHSDCNDYNVLVNDSDVWKNMVIGIIDFGDLVYSHTLNEIAIAAAYEMLNKDNPITIAAQIVNGYHIVFPLTESELEVLFTLICIRLCMSVCISAYQQKQEPDNNYLSISEKPAWELLEWLVDVNPQLVYSTFRHACNLTPCRKSEKVVCWSHENHKHIGSVITHNLKTLKKVIFDLSIGSLEFGNISDLDTKTLSNIIFNRMKVEQVDVGIGRYNEARFIYTSDLFRPKNNEIIENRTIHLGIDLFLNPSSPVFSLLDGVIHTWYSGTMPPSYRYEP